MLSRVSSRWGDDDELEGEGRVQADAQQHSLAHAGNWYVFLFPSLLIFMESCLALT